jgi:hypothetical protein
LVVCQSKRGRVVAICCRTNVYPLLESIARDTLLTGGFEERETGRFRREVPTEEVAVYANFINRTYLEVGINPLITLLEHHAHKRTAAGIMFEISARYAEKVDGEVWQAGVNVPECQKDGMRHLIAKYPEQRMDFNLVCMGWQGVFLATNS